MKNIIILTILLFSVLPCKAETNQMYATTVTGVCGILTSRMMENDFFKKLALNQRLTNAIFQNFLRQPPYLNYGMPSPEQIEEAKKNPESLPAKDFPQGNWGAEANGFQLSCRFEKTTFTNGEPITTTILVRNVSTNYLSYLLPSLEPASFVVSTEQGKTIPEIRGRVSLRPMGIFPETQHKYNERLDSRYSLTNGTYLVNAYLCGAESGKTKITILPANPPEESKTNPPVK